MEYSDFKERREYPRFMVSIPACYPSFDFSYPVYAKTIDISNAGLSLVTDRGLSPGENFDICLKMLDNGEEFRIKGKCIWSKAIESGKYIVGFKLEQSKLNSIPLVLRTIKAQRKY